MARISTGEAKAKAITAHIKELAQKPFEEVDRELGVKAADDVRGSCHGYLSPRHYRMTCGLTESQREKLRR